METKDLVGKYVHFKDNPHLSISTLNGGLTMLNPSSLFYLKIENAEKYKNTQFILLTGMIVNSCGQPQTFSNKLITPSQSICYVVNGKADDEIQPVIAHITNPDFLEIDEIDDGIIIYEFDSENNVFKQCEEKIYVPCIVSRDELSKLFTEEDGLSFRYFFGLPFVCLPVVYDNNNEGKVICYGTTIFQNGKQPGKHNLVQLYYSKTQNLFEYGFVISKYLDIPFYYGQLDFDKSLLGPKI